MKLTQAELARVLGVSRSAVSNWEGGLSTPNAMNLMRLADFGQVSYEWLAMSRGRMANPVPEEEAPAVDGLFVYDNLEIQLVRWYRIASNSQKALVKSILKASPRRSLHEPGRVQPALGVTPPGRQP